MPLHLQEDHLHNDHFNFANNELKAKNLVKTHRANIDFESPATTIIGEIPLAGIVTKVIVNVLTAFDGGSTLNIGVTGNDTKYADYTVLPIQTLGAHIKHLYQREISDINAIATLTVSGGTTQGVAEILIEYSTT